MNGNGIGWAVKQMQQGNPVRRSGWNGKGMQIHIQAFPNCEPCIILYNAQGKTQPGWNASTPDLLATDWEVIEHNISLGLINGDTSILPKE